MNVSLITIIDDYGINIVVIILSVKNYYKININQIIMGLNFNRILTNLRLCSVDDAMHVINKIVMFM